MKTVASMREYINEYVRNKTLTETGSELLYKYFGIPFTVDEELNTYFINRVPMQEQEVEVYIKEFFENLDTTAILELYNKIKA